MTTNPLRDKIAGIPRYQPTLEITDETSVSCYMVACAEGYWISRPVVLAILDTHPEQAEPVEGALFIDSDGDLCIAGRENNLVACLATDGENNNWAPLNPDVFPEIVRRWNAALPSAEQPAPDAVAEAWQPIETAPTDGSHFIAWIDGLPTVIHFEKYEADVAEECGEDGYWAYSENLLADVAETADFDWWMPLPPPPALASQKETQ